MPTVRVGIRADFVEYERIVEENNLIPPDEMRKLTMEYDVSIGTWFTCSTEEGKVIGVAYCALEKVTNQTINMLLLAVSRDRQGLGIGSLILKFAEEHYRLQGGRLMLVETSGLDEFAKARSFYAKNGFSKQGSVQDFYQDGDDKVIYTKRLKARSNE
mmetsp:Transcript_1909/g.3590  ORF Transcript_1909/g.3590 Transcript_1909/m.3590 type:complete len:158 (-) Transcript_1909:836-1309(-)|eukprot:CAMPEP_0196653494 /NCGR_PEP_ID=MMETSP1086-20130531/3140_1 /TAXON_ID=77921 /ORGANISM="Cyanoptyche  gloeocystis , Strain SAG4.97" /LENGTH=157 /DNA_ID=CAMNT_0041984741 /DNA_START=216 /DNA_END=689 /DNA_ORIENTATION=-